MYEIVDPETKDGLSHPSPPQRGTLTVASVDG